MENNLYIMIGLPGSGKDTLAQQMAPHITKLTSIETIILSSDNIRNELYGWEDQTHNGEVFQEMNKRCKKYLQDGKHVIYNATNLNLKRRRALIDEMKKYYNHYQYSRFAHDRGGFYAAACVSAGTSGSL